MAKEESLCTTSNAAQPPLVSFDDDKVAEDDSGDLILIFGGDLPGVKTQRLRVWASVISLVSPIWKAMLDHSKNFAEARKKEIELPEDHPEIAQLVLRLAHHNTKNIPSKLTDAAAIALTIFCDKYDLVAFLRPMARAYGWLIGPEDGSASRRLAWAWTFGDEAGFRATVHEISCCIEVLNGAMKYNGRSIPTRGIDGLKDHIISARNDAIENMVDKLHEFVDYLTTSDSCSFEDCSYHSGGQTKELCAAGMQRMFTKALVGAVPALWLKNPEPSSVSLSPVALAVKLHSCEVNSPYPNHLTCTREIRQMHKQCYVVPGSPGGRPLPEHIIGHLMSQAAR